MRQRLYIIIGLAIIALAIASAASAGNVTATATVTGQGALGLTLPSGPGLTSTLDGTDQVDTYTLGLGVTDARGSGAGWHLSITSTTFNDGSGHTLATSASTITGVTSSCVSGGTCTSPSNSRTYPLGVPAGSTAPTAVDFFNAAANSGLGRFTVTPTIAVTIAGNAYAGSYTSTVTIAAATGP
jgi:WxL domain surface cell wall-binding